MTIKTVSIRITNRPCRCASLTYFVDRFGCQAGDFGITPITGLSKQAGEVMMRDTIDHPLRYRAASRAMNETNGSNVDVLPESPPLLDMMPTTDHSPCYSISALQQPQMHASSFSSTVSAANSASAHQMFFAYNMYGHGAVEIPACDARSGPVTPLSMALVGSADQMKMPAVLTQVQWNPSPRKEQTLPAGNGPSSNQLSASEPCPSFADEGAAVFSTRVDLLMQAIQCRSQSYSPTARASALHMLPSDSNRSKSVKMVQRKALQNTHRRQSHSSNSIVRISDYVHTT